jgi:enamine deaminase RidA (YjgF/YER057c/UK114 family)
MAGNVNVSTSNLAGRTCASTGAAWEPKMGYSRAVRSGNLIAVSGTVGVNPDGTYPASLAEQTRRSLEIIVASIEALGGRVEHTIRTRIFVTDISRWQEVASVHGEVFADIRPTTSMVEVAKLIDSQAQIEIEADAVVP